jgi:hypothetical protein
MLVKPTSTAPEPLHSTTKGNIVPTDGIHATAVKLTSIIPDSKQTKSTQAANLNIPHATLNVEYISSAMAARLSTSLLGHILFLKSQIPL